MHGWGNNWYNVTADTMESTTDSKVESDLTVVSSKDDTTTTTSTVEPRPTVEEAPITEPNLTPTTDVASTSEPVAQPRPTYDGGSTTVTTVTTTTSPSGLPPIIPSGSFGAPMGGASTKSKEGGAPKAKKSWVPIILLASGLLVLVTKKK